jgi:hypothetical protein
MVQLSLDSMEELAWLHLRGGYWSQTLRRSTSSSSGCRTHPVRLGLLPSPWDDVQKSRQASRQTDRQADRQAGRQTRQGKAKQDRKGSVRTETSHPTTIGAASEPAAAAEPGPCIRRTAIT